MTEIAEEYKLDDEEKLIFKNRFADAKETEAPDTSFLDLWGKILYYAGLFGADKAINDKVCSSRPVNFRSPVMLEIKMYRSSAGKISIIYVRDIDDFGQLVTNIGVNKS